MEPTLVTVEQCLAEARQLAAYMRKQQAASRNQHLVYFFTRLAGDNGVGKLAYYLWRRRLRLARP